MNDSHLVDTVRVRRLACIPPHLFHYLIVVCRRFVVVSAASSSSSALRRRSVVVRRVGRDAMRKKGPSLVSSRSGYCAKSERRDCSADGLLSPLSGSWPLADADATNWDVAARACARRCVACAACHYISLSLHWRDCSWFSRCSLNALQHEVGFFRSFAVAAAVPALLGDDQPDPPHQYDLPELFLLGPAHSGSTLLWEQVSTHRRVRHPSIRWGAAPHTGKAPVDLSTSHPPPPPSPSPHPSPPPSPSPSPHPQARSPGSSNTISDGVTAAASAGTGARAGIRTVR